MSGHIPVMIEEVLSALQPKDNERYIDGTFGAGGYTARILDAADCSVLAIDRDPDAIERAQSFKTNFGGRFDIVQDVYAQMDAHVEEASVDGVVLDIGVSSFHIDEADRGFSFMKDGPLDMRMNPDESLSAAGVVNSYDEEELANMFYQYGEERHAKKLARRIVEIRSEIPFETTFQLAKFIEDNLPYSKKDKSHPATRVFQALRIFVNDELGQLREGLIAAEKVLKEGGKLVVVTFHSLEDGIVKAFMKERAGKNQNSGSRYLPVQDTAPQEPSFKLIQNKAIKVSDAETSENPRARSAKLRWAERTGANLWKEAA